MLAPPEKGMTGQIQKFRVNARPNCKTLGFCCKYTSPCTGIQTLCPVSQNQSDLKRRGAGVKIKSKGPRALIFWAEYLRMILKNAPYRKNRITGPILNF